MIETTLQFSIAILLFTGLISDVRTGKVSNKITSAAIVLSLPLLLLHPDLTKILIAGIWIVAGFIGIIGGADMKALVAITLSYINPLQYGIFLLFVVTGSFLTDVIAKITKYDFEFAEMTNGNLDLMKRKIPGFISISIAYFLSIIF